MQMPPKFSPEKQLALRLSQLSWWDRTMFIHGLPNTYKRILKNELNFLRKFDRKYLLHMLGSLSINELNIQKNFSDEAYDGLSDNVTEKVIQLLSNKTDSPEMLLRSIENHLPKSSYLK